MNQSPRKNNTPKELTATTGDYEKTRNGDRDSISGKPHGNKGGKKGRKSTNLPLFETGDEMEFQDINTKDPTKRKVETSGTESSS